MSSIDQQAALECPRCRQVMKKHSVAHVTLDTCERCGGTWFDKDELEVVLERSPEEAEASLRLIDLPDIREARAVAREQDSFLTCPRCRSQMGTKAYALGSSINVDICMQDGLFLDYGVLDQIRGSGFESTLKPTHIKDLRFYPPAKLPPAADTVRTVRPEPKEEDPSIFSRLFSLFS